MEMQIKGCASLLCFSQYAPHKLCKVQDEDDSLENVIRKIKQEVKEIPKYKDYDLSQFIKTNCQIDQSHIIVTNIKPCF